MLRFVHVVMRWGMTGSLAEVSSFGLIDECRNDTCGGFLLSLPRGPGGISLYEAVTTIMRALNRIKNRGRCCPFLQPRAEARVHLSLCCYI